MTVSIGYKGVARDTHTHACLVSGEESICTQNGGYLANMVQKQQRLQWGIEDVPAIPPLSSSLPQMLVQWLWAPQIRWVVYFAVQPQNHSSAKNDIVPRRSLDVLSNWKFESVSDRESILSSQSCQLPSWTPTPTQATSATQRGRHRKVKLMTQQRLAGQKLVQHNRTAPLSIV